MVDKKEALILENLGVAGPHNPKEKTWTS